jgi:hypothetical protein
MTKERTSEQIEADAIAQGWNPNYTGENARTAEEFLEVGKKIPAVQSANNKKLLDKVSGLEIKIQEQNQLFKDFTSQQFKVVAEASKKAYDKAVKDIEAKQLKAVEDGDAEEYKALETEKKDLEKPAPAPKAPEPPKIDPVFTKWHKENSWYKPNGSDDLSMAAETYGKALLNRRPDLTGPAYYKEVEKHIKTVFPDSFKTADPGKLDTGGHDPKPTGKKGFKDLPKEAQKACNDFVKQGMMKQEEYVKSYFDAYGEEL